MKNMAIKETNPGTPKTVIVEIVNKFIGITTLKEFTNKFNPYNNKKAKITFLTTFNSLLIIRSPIKLYVDKLSIYSEICLRSSKAVFKVITSI